MEKIAALSRLLRYCFLLMMVVTVAFPFVYWVLDSQGLNMVLAQASMLPVNQTSRALMFLSEWTYFHRTVGFVLALIPVSVNCFIYYTLVKLFKNYQVGVVFSLKNTRFFRHIAIAIILNQLVLKAVYNALMSLNITYFLGPGNRVLSFTLLSGHSVFLIIAGITTLVISWIMDEARKLNDEQQFTI